MLSNSLEAMRSAQRYEATAQLSHSPQKIIYLDVRIDQKKLYPILANNLFIKTLLIVGCEDITDESLKIVAKNCDLTNLSIRESKEIEGTPIWEMQNLSTLILVECSRIKSQEAILGLPKMQYLTYLNLCNMLIIQTEMSGSQTKQ